MIDARPHVPFGMINIDPFTQTISGHWLLLCLDRNIASWLYIRMATETFAVLAEPMRRALDLLLERPRPVGELAGLLA